MKRLPVQYGGLIVKEYLLKNFKPFNRFTFK